VTRAPRALRGALRWALALAALSFVAWMVPVRDRCTDLRCEPGLASALAGARLAALGGLLAVYALGTLLWAARWRVLLRLAGVELSLGYVWRVSIEAQAGGVLLPGGIGGDALRIASVAARAPSGGAPPPLALVVASVMLDRAVGLAIVTAMASALAFAWGGGLRAGPLAVGLSAVPVALVCGVAVMRGRAVGRLRSRLDGPRGAALRSMIDYVRPPGAPRAIAAAAALSLGVAATQFAAIRGLVWALHATPAAEKWIYLGTAMAFVVSAVPALPGAWGTADAAYVFFFGLAGVGAGTALAVCLLFRLFWYISAVTGAILHLARPRSRPAPASARAGAAPEPPA